MQTGLKDGKVTIHLTFEEYIVYSKLMLHVRSTGIFEEGKLIGAQLFWEEFLKFDAQFNEMVVKEIEKIPDWLRGAIKSGQFNGSSN